MEKINKAKVLITLDSMRYPNTGLYYFGKSLAEALLRQNKEQFDLNFFLYPNTTEFDSTDVKKNYFKSYNKFFFINKNKINLFHFTDQHSRLKPKKVKSGIKILTIHDINQVHENQSATQLKVYLKKLGERIYPCEKIITISKFVARDVLTYFPDVADKISVIYNGVDKLQLPDYHEPLYKPLKPFLFTIGIVSAKKNFHVLPALLANNDYELIISGILTPYKDLIIEQAKKFGVQNRVVITGPVSDQDRCWYYQHCEAFVFPSIAEGFGLPVIEAMNFGKPVFTSTLTSLPEIAGDAAYYFNTFDPEEMQSVFKNGMNDFNRSNQQIKVIEQAGRYNWDKAAQQYLKLYQDCLSTHL